MVVSEILDSELLGEGLLNVLRDAHERLLREVRVFKSMRACTDASVCGAQHTHTQPHRAAP